MRRRRMKISSIVLIILLIAALVVGGVFLYQTLNPQRKESNREESTPHQVEENNPQEVQADTPTEVKEPVPQYDGEDPNTSPEISGFITYAAVSGSNLMIRVNINQLLGSGTCKINLIANGDTVYTDIASIIGSASTSTCEGFNIPTSKLSQGKHQIIIDLSSSGKTGQIVGEVNI